MQLVEKNELTARGKIVTAFDRVCIGRGDALLFSHILPICSLRAPCPAGAAPVSMLRGTLTTGC